jgi:hypothetical protein
MRVSDENEKQEPEAVPEADAPRSEKAAAPRLSLAARLALPEPARTESLEAAQQEGEQFYLRSKSGKQLKQRYGHQIITVGAKPKGFSLAHAVQLLIYQGDHIEEVSLEEA